MAIHESHGDMRQPRETPVELSPVEARQGVLGRPVLYVLVIGLLLAMVAWGSAEYWGAGIDKNAPAVSTQTTEPAVPTDKIAKDALPAGSKRETAPVVIDPTAPANQ